jgi:integrase
VYRVECPPKNIAGYRGRKMATPVRKVQLLKHPNNRSPFWYVRYWELRSDGRTWREVWRSTKTTVKKDAEAIRRKIERELDAGKRYDADMPWCEFVQEFLEKHAVRKSFRTHQTYQECLGLFTKTAKPKRLSDVTLALLEDFANARLKNGVSGPTVNRDLRHIRAALKWAFRREYLVRLPDFTAVFLRVDATQPVTIPEEDFLSMITALQGPDLVLRKRPKEWWRVFLYVAYYLGLRRGEILGLTWDRIHFDTLEARVLAITSKGRKDRVVPLPPELAEVLRKWRDSQGKEDAKGEVLPWPYPSYRQIYSDWHTIQTAAGIEAGQHYVPKNCRSSCASELIAAGVPTVVVKDFLGHATVATTEKYYINTKPALRAAALARKVKVL